MGATRLPWEAGDPGCVVPESCRCTAPGQMRHQGRRIRARAPRILQVDVEARTPRRHGLAKEVLSSPYSRGGAGFFWVPALTTPWENARWEVMAAVVGGHPESPPSETTRGPFFQSRFIHLTKLNQSSLILLFHVGWKEMMQEFKN